MESLYFHPDDEIPEGKLSVPSPLQPQLLNSKDTATTTPPPIENNQSSLFDSSNPLKRKHNEVEAGTAANISSVPP
jgi:hypothetical protein